MHTSDFDFQLPTQLIAQTPAPLRHLSRLLVLKRPHPPGSAAILPALPALSHHPFHDLPSFLRPGDLLVLNDSKVIPARLHGIHTQKQNGFEILLVEETALNNWWAMMRPGKRAPLKTQIEIKTSSGTPSGILATVIDINTEGYRRLVFTGCNNILDELGRLGEMPLPPYIKRLAPSQADVDRYQTVYALHPGSIAAPTAGLHFTPDLLDSLRTAGIGICHVTLHVGPGTFAPVKVEDLQHHAMHEERFAVSDETAAQVNLAKAEGRRVIAVGTTSVRVLESLAAANAGRIMAGPGRTRIFIHPPHSFQIVDALLTNFHLPRSTLLMLVSAFVSPGNTRGCALIQQAYQQAIEERYRFFSYGDAMLIL